MTTHVYRYRPVTDLPDGYPVPPLLRRREGEPATIFVDVTARSLSEATQLIATACNDPAAYFEACREMIEPVTHCPVYLESVRVPDKALPPGLMIPCREGYESAHSQSVALQSRLHAQRGDDSPPSSWWLSGGPFG